MIISLWYQVFDRKGERFFNGVGECSIAQLHTLVIDKFSRFEFVFVFSGKPFLCVLAFDCKVTDRFTTYTQNKRDRSVQNVVLINHIILNTKPRCTEILLIVLPASGKSNNKTTSSQIYDTIVGNRLFPGHRGD